ncbi:alpha-1,2-mannosyltransferase [Saccharothrix tamanrassetensis]|uniref:Alpha-1,2-mannosyltransferase n=1 Tax=Saccharothrix tamanrassetensis TaxID=1051531 RepID=A0A841CPS8_9PSEU|nr:mannosyltransferase [Saccharothrix tamanrassetensis]MBB5959691.1 alpha-1,2-mannosyltransferase [Saccharothrix tamanrassetensis]
MAERRLLRFAPLVLLLSLGRYAWVLGSPDGWGMIDLKVYWSLAPNLLGDRLYSVDMPFTADFPLPFTYPPFAALVFIPLSWLPWLAARVLWQMLSLVCLGWLVRTALGLVAARSGQPWDATWSRRVMLWTALALWCEPVRKTLDFGQINLVLIAGVFAAMVASRQALAGLGVGVAAGLKLTPAISSLYFLVTRRFAAAAWSAAGFALTAAVGFLASPADSWRYWFELLGAADRVGPVGSVINQSLRGALSRSLGYDVGTSWPWLLAVAVSAVLAGFALRAAVRAGDTLATVVAVQLFGLLFSPISWSHHWVWVVPLVLWIGYGAARRGPLAWSLAAAWLVVTGSDLITFLIEQQPSIWEIPRPWPLAALGWCYPLLGLITLAVLPRLLRTDTGAQEQDERPPLTETSKVGRSVG